MDVADSVGIWWRALEKQVVSRWDLLLYIAHQERRHQPATQPVEDDTTRQQLAEARSLLRS